MQYARIQKRAYQDLVNGRGDAKSNVSKIIYYGVVQNLIFNALQQALFGIGFGDDEDEKAIAEQIKGITLPTEEVMIKKVRTAIKIQIKHEIKKAKRLEKNLSSGSAQEYNTTIAKIRSLKEVLSSLMHATFAFVKNVYSKYFTAEGKRRSVDEL